MPPSGSAPGSTQRGRRTCSAGRSRHWAGSDGESTARSSNRTYDPGRPRSGSRPTAARSGSRRLAPARPTRVRCSTCSLRAASAASRALAVDPDRPWLLLDDAGGRCARLGPTATATTTSRRGNGSSPRSPSCSVRSNPPRPSPRCSVRRPGRTSRRHCRGSWHGCSTTTLGGVAGPTRRARQARVARRYCAEGAQSDSARRGTCALGIAASVQHDDLHGGNVLVGPDGDRFFDWGDAVVAHPFGTLTVTFNSIAHTLGLPLHAPAFARLEAAYLAAWDGVAPRADLQAPQRSLAFSAVSAGRWPGSARSAGSRTTRWTALATASRAGSSNSPAASATWPLLDDQALRQGLGFRVLRIELLQRVAHDRRHRQVAEPLPVRRDDVPRRTRRRASCAQRVLVRGQVVVPVLALLEVAQRELPALRRVVVARLEALALLLLVDVQEELDDGRARRRSRSARSR